ncbi:cytochrome b-c1 complex subunit 6, mitochondrial [Bombus affinis]|uniref:Cytochrome b-c1 complex subunit 6 n=1 Tax=Bombus terrestris TaxID=30195 RepID=A0A9B0BZR4_BOMTE|nr:cytochrome b-c1 complex subunit 6, mitochondrial [Bombus terrestris]XP_050579827.1 cytochrome b-c1 complex subunit 6, mitochondrial [Bombus affinis]
MSFLQNFLQRYMPTVKAEEEELIDPQKILRERCSRQPKCTSLQEKLDICNQRVNSRSNTEETCMEELIDYVECVDHCVAKTLFSKLK